MGNFQSTSFYLAQWASKTKSEVKTERRDPIFLQITESDSSRIVCKGEGCILFHEKADSSYYSFGACKRTTLCTETRILKDKLFLKTGSSSETIQCVNYAKRLRTW